jgi:hypothetical protein
MKRPRLALASLMAFTLPACATSAPSLGPAALAPAPAPSALSPEVAAHVRESERLGRLLYEIDDASARATDVLLATLKNPAVANIRGWLPLRHADDASLPEGTFKVLFMTGDASPRVAATVTLSQGAPALFARHEPPLEPSEDVARRFRARTTALAASHRNGQPMNPVVLAGEPDVDGLVVYLLAGTTRPHEIVLGLHYRAVVSADGGSLISLTPLSKTALVISERDLPPGAKAVETVVSHVVTDWPLETHVFASLLNGQRPIVVVTKLGKWRVVGDHVTYEGPMEPQPPRP